MYVNKTYATHGSGGSRMLTDAGEQSRVSTVETEGGESANRQRDGPEVPWVGQEQAPPVIVEVLDGY